jgi:elongation factor G
MDIARIRNIGIIAHIDAGKTTFSERILFYSDVIHRMGEVHEGAATMDFLPEEQERGITIAAACITCLWNGYAINLVDTPGHVDFTIEVERCLRVLDAAVGIFCAVGGVEPQSETVWRQAEGFGIPKLAVVNKLDRPGASFAMVLEAMRARLGARPVPVTTPLGEGEEFRGVLDIISGETLLFDAVSKGKGISRRPFDEEEVSLAAPWRELLMDALTEEDDALLERYLEGESPAPEELRAALRRATLDGKVTPVFAASALRNMGVQPVLDAVCDLLPSPLEVPAARGVPVERIGKNAAVYEDWGTSCSVPPEYIAVPAEPQAPVCALVFKILMERGRKLAFLRLYAGTLKEGDILANATRGGSERISRLFRLYADRREQLAEAGAGDIVAAQGLKSARTGDTLSSESRLVLLEPIRQWRPVISLAFEPKNVEEGQRLDEALAAVAAEDPTVRVAMDEGTGQRIVSGMGELHLEVLAERMQREFGISPRVGNPQVVCRETVKTEAVGEGEFERELGRTLHHGAVTVRVRPLDRGSGVITRTECPTQDIPRVLAQAAEQGVMDATGSGPNGYTVDDVEIAILSMHKREGVSTPVGFQVAAQHAVRAALERAGSVVLEPLMQVDITVPDDFLGSVISLLGVRGAKVESVEDAVGVKRLRAVAAMRELFGFATALRSASQGRAGLMMRFIRFDAHAG